jgi:hypothetical protein
LEFPHPFFGKTTSESVPTKPGTGHRDSEDQPIVLVWKKHNILLLSIFIL